MNVYLTYLTLIIPAIICGLALFKILAFILPHLEKRETMSRKNDLIKEAKKQRITICTNSDIRTEEQIKLLEEELEEEVVQAKEDAIQNENEFQEKEKEYLEEEILLQTKDEAFNLRKEKYEESQKKHLELENNKTEIKEQILSKLSALAEIDRTQQIETFKKSLIYTREREVQTAQKQHIEEVLARASKNAARYLRRSLSRYEPQFVWPKPQNIIELNNSKVIDELGTEDNAILANLREVSEQVNVQFIYDEENTNKACIKVVGGYGVSKEALRIALEESVNKKSVNWDKVIALYRTQYRLLEQQALSLGKKAIEQLQLLDVHPEIQKLVGALNWRTSYRQNQWHHTVEVAVLAGILATELDEDPQRAKRVGLLHDIGKTLDYKIEGSHAVISGDYADRFGEKQDICDTVMSHHDDLIVETPLAYILKTADTLSGARPGARVNLEEGYQIRLSAINEVISSFEGITDVAIMNGGREVHISTNNRKIAEEDLQDLTKNIAKKIEDDVNYPGQIKVVVSRTFESIAVA